MSLWIPEWGRYSPETGRYVNTPEEQALVDAYRAQLANEQSLREEADEAIATLVQRYQNWDSLTDAQKDATNRMVLRAVIALIRLQIRRFETT